VNWPWAVCLLAQGCLAIAPGWPRTHDWTRRYLGYSLARSGLLAAIQRENYWIVWLATEPLSVALLILASLQRIDGLFDGVWIDGRIRRWMQIAAAVLLVAGSGWLLMAGWQWPAVRHGVYLLREIGTMACLSILLVGWALGWLIGRPLQAGWLTAYLALHAALAIARLSLGPEWVRPLNAAGLWAAAALFFAWATAQACSRRGSNPVAARRTRPPE